MKILHRFDNVEHQALKISVNTNKEEKFLSTQLLGMGRPIGPFETLSRT